jgi:hypothetical protein
MLIFVETWMRRICNYVYSIKLLANGKDSNENLEKEEMKNGCFINIKGSNYSDPEVT